MNTDHIQFTDNDYLYTSCQPVKFICKFNVCAFSSVLHDSFEVLVLSFS